jgi:hypothetical protein
MDIKMGAEYVRDVVYNIIKTPVGFVVSGVVRIKDMIVTALKGKNGFLVHIVIGAINKVTVFVNTLVDNWQAVVTMVLASFGLTYLISQASFHFDLPAIFENQMLLPVISSIVVSGIASTVPQGI